MSMLRELLDELTEQLGPPDEGMVTEAVEELTVLMHRVRTAELLEQQRAALDAPVLEGIPDGRSV